MFVLLDPNCVPNFSDKMVRCQVCNRLGIYSKYRRHLKLHLVEGSVSLTDIGDLIFQTRYSRKDTSSTTPALKIGRICSECSSRVLDLKTHITRQHGSSRDDEMYCEILEQSEFSEGKTHFIAGSEIDYNPLFDYSTLKSKIDFNSLPIILNSPKVQKPELMSKSASFYDFPSDSDEGDDLSSQTRIHEQINHDVSKLFLTSIRDFKCFLATDWGGAKLKKSIDMDVSNICRILNNVGKEDFWEANSLSAFFTSQNVKFTPITVHSRVRSFCRFFEYLQGYSSKLLPRDSEVRRISTMLNGVEKSLLHKRDSRMRVVMTENRICYSQTLEVLKKWRSERVLSDKLDLIEQFHTTPDLSICKESYTKVRNFLICECVIPNGQRSGVISGMMVQEVESARTQITIQGHHRIMVAHHKTGSIQSATLFVYSNVFRALRMFVQNVLPKLPVCKSKVSKLCDTSPVFQTFSGNAVATSLVTPFVRCALREMDIVYDGTMTDFRRAAATLTGQLMPSLTDKMSQILGHSRRVHEKHYRVQYGHFGLIEDFLQLENMQSNPLPDESFQQYFDESESGNFAASSSRNNEPPLKHVIPTESDIMLAGTLEFCIH